MRILQLFLLVCGTGKFALVTLVLDSRHDTVPADKMAEQIRRTIESSPLSDGCVVERVTILDENGSALNVLSANKVKEVATA
jgi:hypothetical protein